MKKNLTKKRRKAAGGAATPGLERPYRQLVSDISGLSEQVRRGAARSVNTILTATYWAIGRRIVEHEQGGNARAGYGEKVLPRLAADLTARHGKGFSRRNIEQMRAFFLGWEIAQTPSAQFEARAKCPAVPGELATTTVQTPSISGCGRYRWWRILRDNRPQRVRAHS